MKRIFFVPRLGAMALICAFASSPIAAQDTGHAADKNQMAAWRTEVPIQQVLLSNGSTRYAVQITVGGQSVLVGLDTGSVGLRLLPAAQTGLQSTGRPNHEPFGSGVVLDGSIARAQIVIGTLSNTIGVQQVLGIHCIKGGDQCNAKVGLAAYRVMGDGLPGEGFLGIIGIKPNLDAIPRNPLIQLGAHRWIVSVPQPGSTQPGVLILNPNASDTRGFRAVPSGENPGQVKACLFRSTPTAAHACGNTILDTGAPGLGVFNASISPQAMPGAPAQFVFGNGDSTSPGMTIRLNDRRQMTHFKVADKPDMQGTQIRAGVTPYLAFDILYNADHGTIAVRARPPFPGGPVAQP